MRKVWSGHWKSLLIFVHKSALPSFSHRRVQMCTHLLVTISGDAHYPPASEHVVVRFQCGHQSLDCSLRSWAAERCRQAAMESTWRLLDPIQNQNGCCVFLYT